MKTVIKKIMECWDWRTGLDGIDYVEERHDSFEDAVQAAGENYYEFYNKLNKWKLERRFEPSVLKDFQLIIETVKELNGEYMKKFDAEFLNRHREEALHA